MPLGQIASDNFNRANANPISGSWAALALSGFDHAQIVSNAVEGDALANCDMLYTGVTWPADQGAQLKVVSMSGSGYVGIVLRGTVGGPVYRCYVGPANADGG